MHVRFSNVAKNYHMMSYEYLNGEHPTLRPISIIIFGREVLYVCRLKVVFISIEGRKCGGM